MRFTARISLWAQVTDCRCGFDFLFSERQVDVVRLTRSVPIKYGPGWGALRLLDLPADLAIAVVYKEPGGSAFGLCKLLPLATRASPERWGPRRQFGNPGLVVRQRSHYVCRNCRRPLCSLRFAVRWRIQQKPRKENESNCDEDDPNPTETSSGISKRRLPSLNCICCVELKVPDRSKLQTVYGSHPQPLDGLHVLLSSVSFMLCEAVTWIFGIQALH